MSPFGAEPPAAPRGRRRNASAVRAAMAPVAGMRSASSGAREAGQPLAITSRGDGLPPALLLSPQPEVTFPPLGATSPQGLKMRFGVRQNGRRGGSGADAGRPMLAPRLHALLLIAASLLE